MFRSFLTPLVGFMLLLLCSSAWSQIEEVTVTAERRSENLQDVPVAVTALTSETIEKERIENLSDIARLTPNFTIGQQSPTQPELTIRGIGSSDREAGSDRSVVLFVDDVYVGRAGASTFDLFDLERIEVLRGPQGTLYGRNVVGGAINLISAKPTQETTARIHLGIGSNKLREVKGSLGSGFSDAISGRISFSIKEKDGFYTWREYNDQDMLTGTRNSGATENSSVRGRLLIKPSERFDALLTAEISKDTVAGIPSLVSQGGASDADYAAALAPFIVDRMLADLPAPFTVENNNYGSISRKSLALYGKFNANASFGTFTFIPAWRSNKLNEFRDIAGIQIFRDTTGRPKGFDSTAINDEDYTALSLEARLVSPSDRRFNWIFGVYYLDEEISREQIRERQANQGNSRPLFDQLIDATSTAVFGQASYSFIPERLELTLGGRYTKDKKTFDMAVVNTLTQAEQDAITSVCSPDPADSTSMLCQATTLNPATEVYEANASDSWNAFTPKVALDWHLNEDWLLYASFSKGFKSGGFVGLAPSKAAAEIPFDPETATNLEAGFKANLAANKLQINANFFSTDFRDLQVRRRILLVENDPSSAVVIVSNAASAEIEGIELELIARPVNNFSIQASVAILDAKINKSDAPTEIEVGKALPRSPKLKWGVAGEYIFPLTAGDLIFGANLSHVGEMYYDINEQNAGREPGYTLVNARAAFEHTSGWSVGLWVKNLSDKTYRSHVQSIRGGRAGIAQYGDPMTWGMTFGYQFN